MFLEQCIPGVTDYMVVLVSFGIISSKLAWLNRRLIMVLSILLLKFL